MIPDLCQVTSVLALLLFSELLALVLVLAHSGIERFNWLDFGVVSFLVQWVTLSSAACICPLRPWFRRRGSIVAATISYLIILFFTGVYSFFGHLPFYGDFRVNPLIIINNVLIAAVVAGVMIRYFYLQQKLRGQQHAELHARLQALQSRIHPHFLFNSMNSIASLIDSDPRTAEKVVVDLSQLFRESLSEPGMVTLAKEIKLCERYIAIEKLRLGDRLNVNWHLDNVNLDNQIPGLMLQPLIENAIYHGIQPLAEGGKVVISVTDSEQISITVTNPFQESQKSSKDHNGIALNNIRRRLAAYFGPDGVLEMNTGNNLFVVTIRYPKELNHE